MDEERAEIERAADMYRAAGLGGNLMRTLYTWDTLAPSVYVVSPAKKWWQPRWLYRRIYRRWAKQYEGRLLVMGTVDVGGSKVSIGRVNEDGTITIGGEE